MRYPRLDWAPLWRWHRYEPVAASAMVRQK